ncbi:ubiquitin-conjugating enzyme E2 T-like [Galleria mellonella]|uniref:Ubiquitin-conjugating enzyme E2 T-like n=1 Tax=Galleria mellonella TaxID=7137 RepID=A0ABM3N6P3_GALME|nr:ubiquitin-conjugating enzyme E2 T-like [Galleria mellonella]
MTSAPRAARLAQEMKNFETNSPWGITCVPKTEDNLDVLKVTLLGPKGSPYENGKFQLIITIPDNYPFEPPLLKFDTPIYHPNIDKGGRICMDMLKMPPKGAWLPTITLETLLISLQTLLVNPNPDDPLMLDIANIYKFNIEQYLENARKYTEKYADKI